MLSTLDTSLIFAYLALMIAIGLYASRKQDSVEDFFIAGGRLGTFSIACLWLASWVGGATVVGGVAKAYEFGISGSWYTICMAIGCLTFGLFFAARVKRWGNERQLLTYTDWVQFAMLFIGIVIIGIPIAIESGGTWEALSTQLPSEHFNPTGWGVATMLALGVSLPLSFFVAMDNYTRMFAARNEQVAKRGTLLATVFLLPIAVGTVWIGMTAVLTHPGIENGDSVLSTFVEDAAFWSITISLITVIGWYVGSTLELASIFTVDPLWPGLLVSIVVFTGISVVAGTRE